MPGAFDPTYLEDAIDLLNGAVEDEGSVKHSIKVAIDKIDKFDPTYLEDAIDLLNGTVEEEGSVKYSIKEAIDKIEMPGAFDPSSLIKDIKANADAIDLLNGTVDEEGSIKHSIKVAVDEVYDVYEDIDGQISGVTQSITANSDAIKLLNGTVETEGSIKHSIKALADEFDAKLFSKVDNTALVDLQAQVSTLGTKADNNKASIDKLNGDVNTVGSVSYNIELLRSDINTSLSGKASSSDLVLTQMDVEANAAGIAQNKKDIATLNGSKNTEGSVDYKISVLETNIKELINSISSTANSNSTVLATLSGTVNTLTAGSTVEGSVDYKIAALKKVLEDEIDSIGGTGIDSGTLKIIQENAAAIEILNGETDVEGSVDYKIADALNKLSIPSQLQPLTEEDLEDITSEE